MSYQSKYSYPAPISETFRKKERKTLKESQQYISVKIYIDTNIFIDYFYNRKDKFRDLGSIAGSILRRTLQCEFTVHTSTLVIHELSANNNMTVAKKLFPLLHLRKKLMCVGADEQDILFTEKLCVERSAPFADTLHAVLARKSGADFLVTRNVRDFRNLKELIAVVLPENL